MFVDRVKLFVKAGDGGRGCVSFRREPFVPKGGPDGGQGGHGADVVLVAEASQSTLLPLRFHSHFRAPGGGQGSSGNKTGRSAETLQIPVPAGTVALDLETEQVLGELLAPGDRLRVARGGRGGRGNRSFLSNRNRAPRRADPGEPGEERQLRLDLKLIADVGLVGAPNAGKSTLLSRLSAARPKIGDYPFTTLSPGLGVVSPGEDESAFVLADIPGIIEGASEGAGLGLDFLRHVQRTWVLLHVVDASGVSDSVADLRAVRAEVEGWDASLLERPQLLVATKRDAVSEPDPLPALAAEAERLGLPLVAVSAHTGLGLAELKWLAAGLLKRARAEEKPAGVDA